MPSCLICVCFFFPLHSSLYHNVPFLHLCKCERSFQEQSWAEFTTASDTISPIELRPLPMTFTSQVRVGSYPTVKYYTRSLCSLVLSRWWSTVDILVFNPLGPVLEFYVSGISCYRFTYRCCALIYPFGISNLLLHTVNLMHVLLGFSQDY